VLRLHRPNCRQCRSSQGSDEIPSSHGLGRFQSSVRFLLPFSCPSIEFVDEFERKKKKINEMP